MIDQDADLDENEAEYVKMKIQDLKELCRQRGLSNTGRKQELVDRLGDYDRNGPIWDEIERQIHIPTFRKKSGPRVFLGEDGTPVAYFDLVFTPEIMKLIVEETNRYAEQRLQHPFTFFISFHFISFEGCPSTELIYKGPSIKTLITIYT